MIYEMLKSIVRRRARDAFEQIRLTLATNPVIAQPAECESRDSLSNGMAMDRVRCKLDSKLAKRVGRSMARPDGRRCRR